MIAKGIYWGGLRVAQMATDESLGKGVFSEDYAHFEQNHTAFPVEAQSVFHSVTELRGALSAFRKATENTCVVDDEGAVANVLSATAEEALTEGSSDASTVIADVAETATLLAEASLGSPTCATDISFLDG